MPVSLCIGVNGVDNFVRETEQLLFFEKCYCHKRDCKKLLS